MPETANMRNSKIPEIQREKKIIVNDRFKIYFMSFLSGSHHFLTTVRPTTTNQFQRILSFFFIYLFLLVYQIKHHSLSVCSSAHRQSGSLHNHFDLCWWCCRGRCLFCCMCAVRACVRMRFIIFSQWYFFLSCALMCVHAERTNEFWDTIIMTAHIQWDEDTSQKLYMDIN